MNQNHKYPIRSQHVAWAQPAAKGHVWVPHTVAAGVYADVCDLCYFMELREP